MSHDRQVRLGLEVDHSRIQARFEEDRVKMVLAAFGLEEAKQELLDRHFSETSTRWLTFEDFRVRFPTFPVILDARYVGNVGGRIKLSDLFRRFDQLLLTDQFLESYARHTEADELRPVGVVVPFDGYRGGMVIHNGDFETDGVQFSYPIRGDDPPHRLKAGPFDQFLRHLARGGWTPKSRPWSFLPVARPASNAVPAQVAPWMSRRLGTGPGFSLLVWLLGLTASDSPKHQAFVQRDPNGARYLAITCEDLSKLSGMPPDAVKWGLKVLKSEELIVTVRRGGRTLIVVNLPCNSEAEECI